MVSADGPFLSKHARDHLIGVLLQFGPNVRLPDVEARNPSRAVCGSVFMNTEHLDTRTVVVHCS